MHLKLNQDPKCPLLRKRCFVCEEIEELSKAARIFGRHSRAHCHPRVKTAASPARLNRSEARETLQFEASERQVVAAAAASRDPTDLLEEGERERVTTEDVRRSKPKTRGPSHSPKLARPNIIKYFMGVGRHGDRLVGISRERPTHNRNHITKTLSLKREKK